MERQITLKRTGESNSRIVGSEESKEDGPEGAEFI